MKKKRIGALLLGALMAASLAGCGSDTSWVAKSGDSVMSAGVYILAQMDAYNDAQDIVGEAEADDASSSSSSESDQDELKRILSTQIEGKTGSQFVTDRANDYIKAYFATEKIAEERGITLGESDEAALVNNDNLIWQYSSEFYTKNGVSKESMSKMTRNLTLQDKIMEQMYGAGGEREISEEEYETYFRQSRARIRYIPFSLMTSTYVPMEDEEKEAVREKANSYYERAKAGEDMLDLLAEYQAEIDQKNKEEAEAAGETYEQPDRSNIALGYGDVLVKEGNSSPSKAVVDELFSAPENEVHLIEDSNAIYVAMKVDPMFDRSTYENTKPTLMKELKQEEFDQWLFEQGSALDITYNEAALERYTPDKLNYNLD